MRKSGSKPLSGEEEQSRRSLKPMNSFERESLDDIIHEFDQAENVITNSSEPSKKQHLSHAESFTVDNVLRSADEAMAAPRRTVIQTVTRRPASSTPNKIDETRAPSSADDEDAVELKELIPPTSAGQRKRPSNEIISTKRESISPPPSNAEAVKATLQRESALREEVGQKFHVLLSQMLEFHIKMREANVKINTYASQRAELEVSIEDLQKENNLLQNRLHNRDQSAHRYSLESKKLARGNDVRRAALLLENVEEDFVYKMDPSNQKKKDQSWVSHLEQRFVALLPFSADVRKIDSRFGSSVAAYFDFYRFMFLQFLLVAVVCIILLGYHLASLTNRGQIMGLFNSKGILPGFLNFSSFDPSENLLYSTIVVVGSTIFIITLLFQVIHKDKISKELDAMEVQSNTKYAKEVLCMWDFSLITKKLKDDYSGGVANNLLALLAETRMGAREKTRTSKEYTILVAKRILGWALYLVIQAGAMALVVYITVSAGAINSNVANVSFLRSLAPFFSALTMSFLNATVPVLISYITEYEAWDSPSLELNIRLSRMYLSNIFNVVILAASYALLADPMLLGESQNVFLRRSLEITFNSSIHRCRMNQVAESLFTLLISAFVIKVVMMILNPLADILYNRVKGIAYQKTEFDIASGIVSMLYLATLAMLMFPFAPLALIIVPLLFFLLLKWEKFVMLHLYRIPKRPWKAQKAGEVFSFFYLVSFFLVGIPSSAFFLSVTTFAKSCSIQDNSLHLCASDAIYDATTATCSALNTRSSYYDLFSDSTYCVGGYPFCVCNDACGAFIWDSSNLSPYREKILSMQGLSIIWAGLFTYPYGPWLIITALFLCSFFLRNELKVKIKLHLSKEMMLSARIDALEESSKQREKQLQKIKALEARSSMNSSFIDSKKLFVSRQSVVRR